MRSSNNASFNDYQVFIKKQPEYPRIGRLQYLAEQKIILKNTTPKNVINWFDQYPPVSGMGKLKLAEAYLQQNKTANIKDLIREGWVDAALNRGQLKYYGKKFKKFLSVEDYINRAEYLSWERKYWDLKRLLVYLPKIIELYITQDKF